MNSKSLKLLVFLSIVFVIFSSGCIDFGGKLSLFGITPGAPNYTATENIIVSSDVYPTEVYENKNTSLYFSVSNNGDTTVNNFDLMFTDLCEFNGGSLEKKIDELKPGDYEEWDWDLNAKETNTEKLCTLRYDMSYEGSSTALYDIAAISENEQQKLLRENKIEEIKLNYFKTKSPIDIDISLSKEQPILEDSSFYLYVDLTNVGGGYIEKIEKGHASIKYPDFLELENCDDYDSNGNLNTDLKFVKGKAKRSTCKFKVKKGTVISEIGRFEIKVNYKYMYHKTINVKIKPD